MEVLRAETSEFHHLKNADGPTNSSSASSIVDDDEEEDQFSSVSTADEKMRTTNTSSPVSNNNTKTEIKTESEDRSAEEDDNESEHRASSSPVAQAATSVPPSACVQSLATRLPTLDYARHRERLVKELKDYEDRWMAHRNFLLYTQSFAMKPEDRERLFAQMNGSSNNNANPNDDHSQQHQLQLQQQLFHRLSKDERDRFTAAAFYHHQQQQQQQQQQPSPNPIASPHLYNFHPYPWSQTSSSVVASPPTASPVVVPQPAPPPSASSDQHQPPKSPSSDDSGNQSNSGSTTEWTFEEQFRQLYELSDEPKRKEFLDDLFSFMQKRGTPVNRIPIMAKHVLDLYELFRLVVGKGGLVEVINKKLWREVTKGLNLPSSITSAAFTLRTQYMKYLYPYECEKLQLSSPGELQAAIEGNRREGRRPSYAFEYSSPPQIMPPPPPPNGAFLASPLAHRPLDPTTHGHEAMQHAAMAAAAALSHPFFLASAAASTRDVNHLSLDPPSSTITHRLTPFDDHHHVHHHPAFHHNSSSASSSPTSTLIKSFERSSTTKRSLSPQHSSKQRNDDNTSPAPKKLATTMNNNHSEKMASTSARSTTSITPSTTTSAFSSLSPISKLKIIAKENNLDQQQQSIDKSITISIELNGVAYQGTLYASTFPGKE